jgi:hypothetical protein
MTIVYELEGRLFQTFEDAEESKKLYGYNTSIEAVETDKDYDSFYDAYEAARKEGNSVADALIWAK